MALSNEHHDNNKIQYRAPRMEAREAGEEKIF